MSKAYADDSMKLVERPIYDKKLGIPHSHPSELEGYFTSPWVHGGIIREIYEESDTTKSSAFGWANSSPLGCTFSDKNEIAFNIFRNIAKSDHKGWDDSYQDPHIVSIAFQFYINSKSPNSLEP